VLGGLALSTLLSLLVVPAFYVVADRIKQRVTRRKTAVQLAAQPVADGE